MFEAFLAAVIANADKITSVVVALLATILLVIVVTKFLNYLSKRDTDVAKMVATFQEAQATRNTEQSGMIIESQKAQMKFMEVVENFVGEIQASREALLSFREESRRQSDIHTQKLQDLPKVFSNDVEQKIRSVWSEFDVADKLFQETTLNKLNDILSKLQEIIATGAMMNGVMVVGHNSQIVSLNESGERILGVDRATFVGGYTFNSNLKVVEADGVTPVGVTDLPSQMAIREKKRVNNRLIGVYNEKEKVWRWIIVNVEPVFLSLNADVIQYVIVTFMDAGRLVGVMNNASQS